MKKIKIYKGEFIFMLFFLFFGISYNYYITKKDIFPLLLFFIFLGLYFYFKGKDRKQKKVISKNYEYKDNYKKKIEVNNLNYDYKEIRQNKVSNELLIVSEKIKEEKPINNFSLVYKKKDFLLTKKELKFYNILKELLSNEYTIMCSVRLIDIIEPADKKDYTARAKVIQKHIDFLVCSSGYLNPVLAIELNDTSHKQKKRYERDNFLDLAFQSAGLSLLFVSTRDLDKKENLKSKLSEYVNLK